MAPLLVALVLLLATSPIWADTGCGEIAVGAGELTIAEAKSLVGVHTLGGRRAALQRTLLKSAASCPSSTVKGVDFGAVSEYLQHSDIGSAKNCCRVCAQQQGAAAAANGLGNCVAWISTTKPIFGNQPVCLTLSKHYPAKYFNAKKGTVYNPIANAYKLGSYSKSCSCPAKV